MLTCSSAFIFYPMSAVLTLFIGILRHPLREHASLDLEMLMASTKLIHSMPRHRTSPFTVTYLKQVDALMAELIDLSRAAIAKAKDAS